MSHEEWKTRIEAERKARTPKRRKKLVELPEEWYTALRQELFVKHKIEELDAKQKQLRDTRDEKLSTLCKGVEFEPTSDIQKLDSSSTSTYRSQGYGMHKYAEGALKPMKDALDRKGFTTEIRWKLLFKSDNSKWSTGDTGDYELWANCPPWMYDALERVTTMQDWLDTYKKDAGLNPLVYNPFLPLSAVP